MDSVKVSLENAVNRRAACLPSYSPQLGGALTKNTYCLFDLRAKDPVPKRQDVKGGKAELLWQVRVLPDHR